MNRLLRDRTAVTLVDRDGSCLPGFQDVLRSFGLGLQHVHSAEEGFALLRRSPTPIVVSDLHLPRREPEEPLGGISFVRQLKFTWPDISLMLLAGHEDLERVGDCLSAGADRLLLKPVRPPQLRRALVRALKQQFEPPHGRGWPTPPEFDVKNQLSALRAKLSEALNSLLLTLELRDPTTRGHARRVKRYAMTLAATLGLSPRRQKQIGLAAKMHDIGKVGIAESILRKPGNLTPEEARIVQSHTIIGENLLRTMVDHPRILGAVRHHHERLDGRGYPDRLAGSAIPFEARLISVVDCFDALTSTRPYRLEAVTPTPADLILQRRTDGHLDEDLVQRFIDLLQRHPQLIHEVRSRP